MGSSGVLGNYGDLNDDILLDSCEWWACPRETNKHIQNMKAGRFCSMIFFLEIALVGSMLLAFQGNFNESKLVGYGSGTIPNSEKKAFCFNMFCE